MLTRRVSNRAFLFNPDGRREIDQLFLYALAIVAAKHGILIHAACVMSNHIHLVVTDVRGVLPQFLKDFHQYFALSVKAFRGWTTHVFDKRQTGVQHLRTGKAIIKAIAYVIANGVSCFGVRYSKDWPGFVTLPEDIGRRTYRVRRPNHYYRASNPQWTDEVVLDIDMPEMLLDEYGGELARERIAKAVKELEHRAWQKAKEEGIAFLGPKRVLRIPHTARASSFEPFGALNPTFMAAGDPEAAAAAVAEKRAFEAAYRDALCRWQARDRRVLFPPGTWWMCVHHGARSHAPPPS